MSKHVCLSTFYSPHILRKQRKGRNRGCGALNVRWISGLRRHLAQDLWRFSCPRKLPETCVESRKTYLLLVPPQSRFLEASPKLGLKFWAESYNASEDLLVRSITFMMLPVATGFLKHKYSFANTIKCKCRSACAQYQI